MDMPLVRHFRPECFRQPLEGEFADHVGGNIGLPHLARWRLKIAGRPGAEHRWLGRRVLAQDPETCRARSMPLAAIDTGTIDFVLPPDKIAAALVAKLPVEIQPGAVAGT
jgi:hypothetical protein